MPFLQSSTAYRQESTRFTCYRNGCCRCRGLPARPSAPTDACRLTVCRSAHSSRPAQRRSNRRVGPQPEPPAYFFPASSPPMVFPNAPAKRSSTDKQYFHAAPAAVYRQRLKSYADGNGPLLQRTTHRFQQRAVNAGDGRRPTRRNRRSCSRWKPAYTPC